MRNFRDVTFGEHLFSRIDDNAYLQKLYHNILINYSKRLFRLDGMEEQPVNIGDALTLQTCFQNHAAQTCQIFIRLVRRKWSHCFTICTLKMSR